MKEIVALFALIAALAPHASRAAEFKPLVLPKAPPAVSQPLPLGAQPTGNGGVYIPVTKSGNGGVSVGGLPNPAPGETGGSIGWTIKTK